jgi:hypothetical protein
MVVVFGAVGKTSAGEMVRSMGTLKVDAIVGFMIYC